MQQERFKIVFTGQLMPEATLAETKDKLANLFKTDPQKIDALFSGQLNTLKRNLDEAEADKYLAVLHKAGAQARKEPDLSANLTLVSLESDAEAAADQAQMRCPKCAHDQPRAPVCSACGVVIEKFIARQAQLAEAPPAAAAAPSNSPYSTPKAQVGEVLPEHGELKVFGVTGRIGRVRYLAWSAVLLFALLGLYFLSAVLMALVPVLGGLVLAAVGIAALVVSVQIGVQRLHDIGWSGWLWLVNLIPLVGSVFALIMLIVPGTNGANRFGPPPPPNTTAVKVLAFGWLIVPVIIGILAAIAIPQYQEYIQRAEQAQMQDQSEQQE